MFETDEDFLKYASPLIFQSIVGLNEKLAVEQIIKESIKYSKLLLKGIKKARKPEKTLNFGEDASPY